MKAKLMEKRNLECDGLLLKFCGAGAVTLALAVHLPGFNVETKVKQAFSIAPPALQQTNRAVNHGP